MNAQRIQIVQFFFFKFLLLKLINSIFIELNLLSCFIYYSDSLAVIGISANREHEYYQDESFVYNYLYMRMYVQQSAKEAEQFLYEAHKSKLTSTFTHKIMLISHLLYEYIDNLL